ncbi:CDC45-like domain-containing protein [Fadolivirus algeromassiliense]|uniref:CDC45-like domain-containing protein n=1 Tax=Fadolivirus FV1/VV64 TaxID=3070911 RepID=A0A7D3R068_9VIRU|nr:CDC45-like domain-containing protein [Fadolivirus algeromassiliense]QKF93482.1 CDC45-like domain-containing protein [Fadolivirus FV1/VV64]
MSNQDIEEIFNYLDDLENMINQIDDIISDNYESDDYESDDYESDNYESDNYESDDYESDDYESDNKSTQSANSQKSNKQLIKEQEKAQRRKEKLERRHARYVKSDKPALKANMKAETNFPIPDTFKDMFGDDAVHDETKLPNKLKHIKNIRMLNNSYDPLTGKYIKKIWTYKRTKIDRVKRDLVWEYFRHRKTTSIVDTILESHYGGLKVIQVIYFDDPVQHNIIIFDELIKFYKKVKEQRKTLTLPQVSNKAIKKMNADSKIVKERWEYIKNTFNVNDNDTQQNVINKIETYLMSNNMFESYPPHKCNRFKINKEMQQVLGLNFEVFILCPHNGMYHEYCTTWDKILKPFVINKLIV